MKFNQIRKLVDVLIEEDEITVSGVKPEITVELGEESIRQLNQDILSEYPDFLRYIVKNPNPTEYGITKISLQGHIINIKEKK